MSALESIEGFLRKRETPFTLGDLMSQTGMPGHELEEGLEEAMAKYRCGLQATEEGDLLYDFGPTLVRRTHVTVGERARKVGRALWKAFSVVYKASLAIILAVYFVVFVVVLIAIIVGLIAASAKADSDDGANAAGSLFGVIGRLFVSIFEIWTHTAIIYQPVDPHGYRYQHFDPRQTHWPISKKRKYESEKDEHNRKKSFIASVYDFALGPPRVKVDPLASERELASFVRKNSGVATTSEVQALGGFETKRASEFLTSAIVNFKGTAEISENGTFYGQFDDLIRGTERDDEEPVVWFWDEYVPEVELTGNTTRRNVLIVFMNSFNLLFAYLFLSGALTELFPVGAAGMFWLAWFPLCFSISLFALPLLRWGWVKRGQTKQHIENIRRRLFRALFENHDSEFTVESLTDKANEGRTTEEKLSAKRIEDVVKRMVEDLGGDSSVSGGVDDGEELAEAKIVYRFERITNELTDIAAIRQNLLPETSAGKPVALLE